jgi:putative phosphoesterase
MKLLVISDTHGFENELVEIKERYEKEVDYMFHCGDSELPSTHKAIQGFLVVRGNCDFDHGFPNEIVEQVNDHIRLYATHGHLYNVKMTLMNIQYRAEEAGATIICFGHSHLAGSELVGNKIFINPGSFRLPRRIVERTYCLLEIQGKTVKVDFYDHENKRLDELCSTYTLEIE